MKNTDFWGKIPKDIVLLTDGEKMNVEFEFRERYSCEDLLKIVSVLRAPGGCPWDAEQTHESIRKDFIEETYEVIEAINKKNPDMLREELGDVLLQVVFHTLIETEKGTFTFDDVTDEICKKLIIRHPHVFGDVEVSSTSEVLTNWDAIKMNTKNQKTVTDTMMSVPREFPALMRAAKIQKKASKVGYDWDNAALALEKVKEEAAETEKALNSNNKEDIMEEIGDLLFAAVNVARKSDIDPEEALTVATDKFVKRFSYAENAACEKGIDLKEADEKTKDILWNEAKEKTKDNA